MGWYRKKTHWEEKTRQLTLKQTREKMRRRRKARVIKISYQLHQQQQKKEWKNEKKTNSNKTSEEWEAVTMKWCTVDSFMITSQVNFFLSLSPSAPFIVLCIIAWMWWIFLLLIFFLSSSRSSSHDSADVHHVKQWEELIIDVASEQSNGY